MKKLIFSSIIMLSILPLFAQQQGIFKDTRDGKEYKTVVIATQTWLAENLAFKPAEGVYWAYDNNQINIPKYGYLYNWETAKNVLIVWSCFLVYNYLIHTFLTAIPLVPCSLKRYIPGIKSAVFKECGLPNIFSVPTICPARL